MAALELWHIIPIMIVIIPVIYILAYYLDKLNRNHQRLAKQAKKKIKKMSCEELRQYIIDEEDFDWFAQKVLDVKYRCDSTQDKNEGKHI